MWRPIERTNTKLFHIQKLTNNDRNTIQSHSFATKLNRSGNRYLFLFIRFVYRIFTDEICAQAQHSRCLAIFCASHIVQSAHWDTLQTVEKWKRTSVSINECHQHCMPLHWMSHVCSIVVVDHRINGNAFELKQCDCRAIKMTNKKKKHRKFKFFI